jgi:hypothetical protein
MLSTRLRHLLQGIPLLFLAACSNTESRKPVIDIGQFAKQYYGEDAKWFMDNTPFFECSDKKLEQVFYYRWKMYKAHIRNVGLNEFVITEFINHVGWDRDPYCTINAASMHHIYEGRWLKDNRYMDGYINYLFQQGGNDRRYSESIADAAYARFLVNGDTAFIVRQLDSMKMVYNKWADHFDSTRQLYYIPAMPDATEYTIASIDASGGKDGFEGGDAFRPTINSYMYGNAMAIAKIALLKNDYATAKEYQERADNLKYNVESNLWSDTLQHFADRFKVNNKYVHNWDFIRGRELAGMIPWYFDLPADEARFNSAWRHVLDTSQLLGKYGLRTNEPSYPYYFHQFVYFDGARGSQWNGPSWPYQTSQVLTGMANLLNDYKQTSVTSSDYLGLLKQFAGQHYLSDSVINLVENYDPNLGGPIVHYYWSNHYNHSAFNNLIITGLCGIRPSMSDTLTINPLIDSTISYFALSNLNYHGHRITVVYDRDGTKYNMGKGLSVLVDRSPTDVQQVNGKYQVNLGPTFHIISLPQNPNYALNITHTGYPVPSASINSFPDTSLFQAIDGRKWFFSEITNRWTTEGSSMPADWYGLDFGKPQSVSMVRIYLMADNKKFGVPDSVSISYNNGTQWLPVKLTVEKSAPLAGNTTNTIVFDKVQATGIRLSFKHPKSQVALSELECY